MGHITMLKKDKWSAFLCIACIYTRHMLPPPPNSQQEPFLSLFLSTYTHNSLSLSLSTNTHSHWSKAQLETPIMMQKFQLFVVLFLFVLLLSKTDSSARKLAAKEEVDVQAIQISSKDSVVNQENSDSFDKLIGIDECQNEDEECLKRRVVTEAHLDYIYTQHHKP